jgi:type II secretory pathway pseudopilin PulG
MALDVAQGFLPSLNQATGLNAQMQQMQAGQTNLQQAILQGQQEREVTIETMNPLLANLLLKLCEVPTVNQLPAFWALNPRSNKSTSWMSNLETTCLTIGNGLAATTATTPDYIAFLGNRYLYWTLCRILDLATS